MAVNLVSPGVKIREIDLTLGRIDAANDQVAAFAGPFQKGPVDLPVLIQSESELRNIFGDPLTENGQNEYWLTASNYLSYGGIMQIVRVDSTEDKKMGNAYSSVGIGSTGKVKIKSTEDYINRSGQSLDTSLSEFYYCAKNPGTWGNNLTVYAIDAGADQIISGISTSSVNVGYGVTVGINTQFGSSIGVGTFTGYLKGVITGIGASAIDVKLISRHNTSNNTSEFIEYSEGSQLNSITVDLPVVIYNNSSAAIATFTSYKVNDWYNQQTVRLGQNTVFWRNIAEKPGTSEYSANNGGKNDEINILVVDNTGEITGIPGEILENHKKLSKALDGRISPAQPIYYKDYLRDNSNYIFVGAASSGTSSRFNTIDGFGSYSQGTWGKKAKDSSFDVIGNKTYELDFGTDYSTSISSNYGVRLDDVTNAYSLFENATDYNLNYIISGPSGGNSIFEAQAKANYIISIAEKRKDCIAVISAYGADVINNTTNSTTQTNNIIKFFSGLTGSTYAVFDAGYKYTYDRFNNQFLYLACNSDVAGLMARTSINQFPWYSPAGATRGVLNNVIKLAYNPSEAQRDLLYTNRINPIITSPGQGTILYGDKTASSYVSAFDRINVRRLFLTIERTIERAARSQLFEFNDEITRSSFINLVDPYLRDVTVKRGITDYVLICDETNNTPDVIDSNQFRADIFVKPNRSINFINITFVATRTGISFSEVVGNV